MKPAVWYEIPELRDRDTLAALVKEYWSAANIAAKLGCSVNSVRGALRFHRLPLVPVSRRMRPAEKKGGSHD